MDCISNINSKAQTQPALHCGESVSSQEQAPLPNIPTPEQNSSAAAPPHRSKKGGRPTQAKLTALAPDLPAPQVQKEKLSSIILNNGKTDTKHPVNPRIPTFSRNGNAEKTMAFFSVTHDHHQELIESLNDEMDAIKKDKSFSNRQRAAELKRVAAMKKTILRDGLDSALGAATPDIEWKKLTTENWWEWSNMFRAATGIAAGIKNETVHDRHGKQIKRRKFAVYNWLNCYRQTYKNATMSEYDDVPDKYVAVRGCSDRNCPTCRETDRRKQYGEAFDHLKVLVPLHNLKQFFNVTVTVPDEISAKIIKLSDRDRKTLEKNMMGILRDAMGFEKTDNLWGGNAFHPVGDSRKMADRGHWHMFAVPLAVRQVAKNDYKTEKRTDFFLINRAELERKMRREIQKYFDFQMDQIVVHLEYVNLQKKRWDAQVYHKIKYVLRSFGNDFMERVLRYDPKTGLIVLQHGADNEYVITTVHRYARQWIHVNKHRTGSFYGALRMREKFAAALGLKRVVGEKIPEPTFVKMVKLVLARGLKAVKVEQDDQENTISDMYLRNPKRQRVQVQWIREWYVYEYDEDGNEHLVPPDDLHRGQRGRTREWVPLDQTLPIAA